MRHALPENNCMAAHLEVPGHYACVVYLNMSPGLALGWPSELIAVKNRSLSTNGRTLCHLQIHMQNLGPEPSASERDLLPVMDLGLRPVAPTHKVWLFWRLPAIKFPTDLPKVLHLVWNTRDAFQGQSSGPRCLGQWH